jgi:EmrB/QacA subfamily drug resistance transporter
VRRALPPGAAIALLVAGAFFMENLDGTVVVTAMPQMAASFGVHPVDLHIGISAYILTLAVLIPASGWVADRLGPRRVFAGAIVIFTLASALCGLSTSLGGFTAARILQGVGGAMMVPVGRLVVLRNTAKADLMSAIATITWPGLAAPILGPPVGGFITTYASWHWIFFLNLPLGLVGLGFALRLIPAGWGTSVKPFDVLGFLLTGAACLGLMYGLDQISDGTNADVSAWLFILAALALGALAVRHARRQAHPLVDLWALGVRSYAVTTYGGSLFRMAIGAVPFLLPLLFQIGFGLDPFRSGLLVLAVFAGNLGMKPMTSPVLRRFGFRTTMIGTGILNAVAILGCATFTPATPVPIILAVLFISGLLRSMQFTALNTLAFADVPEGRMSGANTLFNMAQQMAMGLGIALGAVALRVAAMLHPAASGPIPLIDFHIAFAIVGGVALVAVLDSFWLAFDAGDNLRHRGRPPSPAVPVAQSGSPSSRG